MQAEKIMSLNIGLTDEARAGVAARLNGLLADEIELYQLTRKYHWNVEGPHFMQFHKFFEEQYDALAGMIDEVAERIRMIGHYAIGTVAEVRSHATLNPSGPAGASEDVMLHDLRDCHEAIIRRVRTDIPRVNDEWNDVGTADFLTGLMEAHEKMAWMLRAHLRV